jgi:hypothetical protein
MASVENLAKLIEVCKTTPLKELLGNLREGQPLGLPSGPNNTQFPLFPDAQDFAVTMDPKRLQDQETRTIVVTAIERLALQEKEAADLLAKF